jgi:ribosomal protein S18 acetylase RimI-like enzyme
MAVSHLSALPGADLIELRHLSGEDLHPVLDEETAAWKTALDWDFRPSAELVVRFVNMQALSGYALLVNRRIAGYCYSIAEESKGLIGDIYVKRQHRNRMRENRLLEAVLMELWERAGVQRIESQLMMLDSSADRPMPFPYRMQAFRRTFMMRQAGPPLAEGRAAASLLFEPWRDERIEEAAQLIAICYRGHIDSLINDQYQSIAGARRFLLNIVQYPGCGRFCHEASFVAFDRRSGSPCGMVLSSMVASDVGHITQLCVLPEVRGTGVGYDLMRRSLDGLESYGCSKVSLTVTTANTSAISLYEGMGFIRQREFAAHVWE